VKDSEFIFTVLTDEMELIRPEEAVSGLSRFCDQGRALVQHLNSLEYRKPPLQELLYLMHGVQQLEASHQQWRSGPEWGYKTVKREDIDGAPPTFPPLVELHPDNWLAYEWNYHRAARALMHEKLLACLEHAALAGDATPSRTDSAAMEKSRVASEATIRVVADQILSSVPQMLNDVDRTGKVSKAFRGDSAQGSDVVGACLLLWPIKIVLSNRYTTASQKHQGTKVFERIRAYPALKGGLGPLSVVDSAFWGNLSSRKATEGNETAERV
jgi:hypothetical protein